MFTDNEYYRIASLWCSHADGSGQAWRDWPAYNHITLHIIPEPVTLLLLGFGAVMVRKRYLTSLANRAKIYLSRPLPFLRICPPTNMQVGAFYILLAGFGVVLFRKRR